MITKYQKPLPDIHGPCEITKTNIEKLVKVDEDGNREDSKFDLRFTCQINLNVDPQCTVNWRYSQKIYSKGILDQDHDKNYLVFKGGHF